MLEDEDVEPPDLIRHTPAKKTHRRAASISSDIVILSDLEADVNNDVKSKAVSRRALSDPQLNIPSSPIPSAIAVDPLDALQIKVLEILPDVDGEYLRNLLSNSYANHGDQAVELTLHQLFEDASYPRSEKTLGKRKRVADSNSGEQKRPKLTVDYTSLQREFKGGPHYNDLAFTQLLLDFPLIPKPYVRHKFQNHRSFYAPTYLFLSEQLEGGNLPYKLKTIPSRVIGKGNQMHDNEFNEERTWLLEYLGKRNEPGPSISNASNEEAEESDVGECEDGIECGCCFSTFAFDKMVQCPEAHLFCRSCCRAHAANQLGMQVHLIRCMDQSGCKELFPVSELQRMLPAKLLELYHRLKQSKEIEAAQLDGLEECPFCEYKVVIENQEEKLFRCEAEDCGAVTCRSCKKPDHLPKSCKEVEDDYNLDVKHVIEEAMTKALMRNCPKCSKSFVKDHGCNKMSCPYCSTLSCYICREVITSYDHFVQHPSRNSSKCPLWDSTDDRHTKEVREAAEKAIAEYKEKHPEISEEALQVDIPKEISQSSKNPIIGYAMGYPVIGHPAMGHPAMGYPVMGHPALGHPAMGHPAMGHPAMGHPGQGGPAVPPGGLPWLIQPHIQMVRQPIPLQVNEEREQRERRAHIQQLRQTDMAQRRQRLAARQIPAAVNMAHRMAPHIAVPNQHQAWGRPQHNQQGR